jgi:hypothetical protein
MEDNVASQDGATWGVSYLDQRDLRHACRSSARLRNRSYWPPCACAGSKILLPLCRLMMEGNVASQETELLGR